jgi:hypothetical protein
MTKSLPDHGISGYPSPNCTKNRLNNTLAVKPIFTSLPLLRIRIPVAISKAASSNAKNVMHATLYAEQYPGHGNVVGELGEQVESKAPVRPVVAKPDAADQACVVFVNYRLYPHYGRDARDTCDGLYPTTQGTHFVFQMGEINGRDQKYLN